MGHRDAAFKPANKAHLFVITLGKFTASKCEISTTREAAHAGTTTIIQAKVVETRKWVGRETGTTREKETETGSVIQTIVAATEAGSTT